MNSPPERDRFIGEGIEVEAGKCYPELKSFVWRGHKHGVKRVVAAWQDYGFASWMKKPRWWQRHHKNYYRIETDEGRLFEIYCDRGSGKKAWVLFKEM